MTNERLFRVRARKREGRCYELAYNPTGGLPDQFQGASRVAIVASIDPVAKQVFADCPDRGTTAAVGESGQSTRARSALRRAWLIQERRPMLILKPVQQGKDA